MDADGDGSVTALELTKWLTARGVRPDFGLVSAIIKYFDIDGDGHITLDEIISRSHDNQLNGGMNTLPGEVKKKTPCILRLISNQSGTSTHVKKILNVAKFLGM